MKKNLLHSIVILVLLFSFASAASADLIDGSHVEKILNIARGYGSATLEEDSVGDPMIRGRMDGTIYVVFFYKSSENSDYNSIQFRASWEKSGISLETLNGWNAANRFGKAYLDKDGDPVVELSVNMDHGVSYKNLDDTFDWWKVIVRGFKKDILEL